MQAAQVSMVHESEAQRRHARIRIPSHLKVDIDGKAYAFDLLDLSASGFAIQDTQGVLQQGDNAKGLLVFKIDSLELSLNINFQVVSHEGDDLARVGCEFHDLGNREISTLRMLITKFLSGEVAAVSDVLTTLSRDNFTKARNNNSQPLDTAGRIRALAGTTLVLAAGLLAFGYIASNLYQNFFVTQAVTAVVSIPSELAIAPREGYVKPLVKVGDKVLVGQPIATIDSPLLEMMQPVAAASGMDREELRDMLSKRVGGVIESQCDCVVVDNMIENGKYLLKGETGLKLAPVGATPEVKAHFQFEDLSALSVGDTVQMSLGQGLGEGNGQITDVRLPQSIEEGYQQGTVLVTIKPEATLTLDMVNRPVSASVGGFL